MVALMPRCMAATISDINHYLISAQLAAAHKCKYKIDKHKVYTQFTIINHLPLPPPRSQLDAHFISNSVPSAITKIYVAINMLNE